MGRPAADCGLTARTVLHQAHEGADKWGHPLAPRGKPACRHPQAVQELPSCRVQGRLQSIADDLRMAHDIIATRFASTCRDKLSDLLEATRLLTSLCKEGRNFVRHLRKCYNIHRHAALVLLEDAACANGRADSGGS